jgi:multidrug efflux system membrane fusion protein
MSNRQLAGVLTCIRRAAAPGDGGTSDAELLNRFVAHGDEAAFELLVWRHRRLVFGVCLRVAGHFHEAEDAFQATFLALAKKGGSIGNREAVASWLYKVAYRAALAARTQRSRRTAREQALGAGGAIAVLPGAVISPEGTELRAVLDEEVNRLPEGFREAVVLCYLEGKTLDQAAVQLGCPRGTVASRLARARERLRRRLVRRGLTLTGAAVATALSTAESYAAPAAPAIRAAWLWAGGHTAAGLGVPSRVAALAEEALKGMLMRKVTSGVVILTALAGALLLGAGFTAHAGATAGPEPAKGERVAATQSRFAAVRTPVRVQRPLQREIAPCEVFTGRIEPAPALELRSQLSGRIQTVHFKEGENVKKGDVLFEIDPKPFQASLDAAKANLIQARANEKRTAAELERARNDFKTGKIKHLEVLDQIEADNAQAKATVGVAEASLDQARLMMAYTSIRAPFNGKAGKPLVVPGDLVRAEGKTATVLTTLTLHDRLGVRFDMDERSLLRYRRLQKAGQVKETGGPLRVGVADEDEFPREGTLERFDDRLNPDTGTVGVHGLVSNSDGLLLPGMFARVRVPFGKPRPVLEVPESAIGSDDGKRFVLIVDDRNIVQRRIVKLGERDGELRVIEEGLRPDDWVIVSGLKGPQPGDPVEPRRRSISRRRHAGKE